MRHDSSTSETWLIHVWDMTHPCMRHDSFIPESLARLQASFLNPGVSWPCVRTPPPPTNWVTTHMNEPYHAWISYVTHESCVVTMWRDFPPTYKWIMTPIFEPCHAWMTHMNESCRIYAWVVTHIWWTRHMHASCHTSLIHVWRDSYVCLIHHMGVTTHAHLHTSTNELCVYSHVPTKPPSKNINFSRWCSWSHVNTYTTHL